MIHSVILLGKVDKNHHWTHRSVLGPVASMRVRPEVRFMSTYSWIFKGWLQLPVVRLVHKGNPYESQPKCQLPNQISNFG